MAPNVGLGRSTLRLRARSFGIFRTIRIYSRIYSDYSAPGSRIAGMEIQVFRNENSSQTNAYSRYSNYSYSGLIPNERALRVSCSTDWPSRACLIWRFGVCNTTISLPSTSDRYYACEEWVDKFNQTRAYLSFKDALRPLRSTCSRVHISRS